MTKTKTIKLKYFDYHVTSKTETWKVQVVTDSVEFNPGQMLDKNEVQQLCENKYWKVTISVD